MTENVYGHGDCEDTVISEFDIANYSSIQDANTALNTARIGDLSVLYINIVSLPCNMNELHQFLSNFDAKPDIIALSETKITVNVNAHYHPYLENYKFFRIKSKSFAGGVGLFIRDTLTYDIRNDLNCSEYRQFEMLWVDISSSEPNSTKTTIGIIYRYGGWPSIPYFTTKLESIINKLNRDQKNTYYIFGDFNINLFKTEDVYNIAEFVNTLHSLNALNMINKPTRFPIGKQPGNPSLLDHIWTNQPGRVKQIDLIVNPISDHRPTLCILNLNKKITKLHDNAYFIRDMKNFDLDAFNESLFEFHEKKSEGADLEQNFSNLQSHILECINKYAPLRKRTRKEKKFASKPWISECIQISIDNKNNLYQYLQKNDRPDLKQKYNKMKKTLQKTLIAAETKFYDHQFVRCQNNSRKTWRLINEITCRKKRDKVTIHALKAASGSISSDAKTMANTLNAYFTNIGINMSNNLPPSPISHQDFLKNKIYRNSFYLKPTDPMEIYKVINSFKSVVGPDKIPAKFFKLGSPALSNILSDMINECFLSGIFPQALKLARVTPIYKEGPKDAPCNYRPISIISVLSKLVEKLTYNRLIKYIDKKSILHSCQFGFRSAHSTTHAITSIHERVLENVNNDKHTISIYLDLSKAFDSVNHNILLSKLHYYGIRGVALNFFRSYLSNRQQYTIVNGVASDILSVLCGVPQGSTLGPLLFLLYINDLAVASKFSVSLFADDTCLLLSDKNLGSLQHLCNMELIQINNWFLANKLTANLSKASKYMITLGKSRTHPPDNFNIVMGNTTLEKVTSIKYLGVIFDVNFNWHDHITYVCTKISRSVGVLSKLRYYVNIKTLLKVYYSLVSSHLCYALTAWGRAGVTALHPLKVLQNRAIRFISRAPRFRRLDNDYINLRLLKFDDMHKHAVSKFMHQYYHGKLPDYFSNFFGTTQPNHEYNLRRNANENFRPVDCRKASMERSIRYIGPKLWENIPMDIKTASVHKFKKDYKNFLLAKY